MYTDEGDIEVRAGYIGTAAPRKIVGVAIRYGTIAEVRDYGRGRTYKERVLPGAFGNLADQDILLNWRHHRNDPVARSRGGGLFLDDSLTQLSIRADLPDTDEARNLWESVKGGVDRGLSVEMKVTADFWSGDLRTITKAQLQGVGVATLPVYENTEVEARAKGGGRAGLGREDFLNTKMVFGKASGWITLNQAISCECRGGPAEQVVFEEGSLDDMVSGKSPMLAVLGGGFQNAVASTIKKTLRFSQQKGRVKYEIDLPDTQITRDLLAQSEFVDFFGRPLITDTGSKSVVRDGVRHYSEVNTRALLIKPTDANKGWSPIEFGEKRSAPLEPIETRHEKKKEFRFWL